MLYWTLHQDSQEQTGILQKKKDICHDPLPVEILLAALEYRDSAEDMDKGRVNTFKLC